METQKLQVTVRRLQRYDVLITKPPFCSLPPVRVGEALGGGRSISVWRLQIHFVEVCVCVCVLGVPAVL